MPVHLPPWQLAALLLVAAVSAGWLYRLMYPRRLRRLARHLRAREERYRRLVQTADVGVMVLDAGYQVLEWNQALERLFGLTRDAIRGGDFFSYCIFPEDLNRVAAALGSQHDDDDVFDAEFPVRARHDERRMLRWRVRRYTDPVLGERRLMAVGHDVTELRTATFRLMASEARFRQIFQFAPVAMALAEPDGHLLMVNQEYARFLECRQPDELTGKSLLDDVPAEDRERFARAIRTASRDGSYRLEQRFVTRRGQVRWAYARGLLVESDFGQPYLVNQIADIHERKKAELALTEHRNQLLAAQRIARLGAWQWGVGSEQIQLSDVLLELLQYEPGSPLPGIRVLESLVVPEDLAMARERLRQLRQDGTHVVIELQACTLRGEPRHWRVDATVQRDAQGRAERLLGTTQDITEAKRIEAERVQLQRGMQQAQKMEAIGQLAGGIAHDFNNILASILGYTELALGRESVAGDSRLQRHLQEVKLAGERARELIGQMAVFSRGGRRAASLQPVADSLHEALSLLHPTLPASLRLLTLVDDALPLIRIDGVAVQQIVMNLVINARDAMGARGEVVVLARRNLLAACRCVSCNQPVSGDYVEIAVQDQGPGIPEAVRERMFDPFYTTKPVGQGTGMGLSVVHGTVHEFGGHLLVESSAGGTVFRVLFPVPEQAGPGPHVVPERVLPRGQGERILVVDDEPSVADMLGELLEVHGYAVEVFCDSRLASQRLALAGGEFDLLLTDRIMPHVDGVDLAQAARRRFPGLPVVMLSGQAGLLENDTLDWPLLPKPVDTAILLQCIATALEPARRARA